MKHILDPDKPQEIQQVLNEVGFLDGDKSLSKVEKLTHGNMNLTLRGVLSDHSSFILKQGRSWVEKYPEIAAPVGRTAVEAWFFKQTNTQSKLAKHSPQVLFFDQDNQILILEDLGNIKDGIYLYEQRPKDLSYLKEPISYLTELHKIIKDSLPAESLEPLQENNLEMRQLNAHHMFDFPFSQDGLMWIKENLPKRQDLAKEECANLSLKIAASEWKELYLKGGDYLLHGDYYPGSWIYKNDHFYAIDPEFGFFGPKEFDLGVFIAHCCFVNKTILKLESPLFDSYRAEHTNIDSRLVYNMAGIEILRRIFGVAQLPLPKEELSTIKTYSTLALNLIQA